MDYLPGHTPALSQSNRVNVKSFFVFLAAVVVIGAVWALKPILDNRARDHEKRLVASLDLVEEAVVSASTDILRVDLFSPEIAQISDDGRWRVTGILETQDRAGKAVFVRYIAKVAFSCTPYSKADCGKIETLSIEDQPLVIDSAIVAELQSVLSGTNDALSEALPGGETALGTAETGDAPVATAAPASIPAPQLDTAAPDPSPAVDAPTATAAVPPAVELPAEELPAVEPPAVEPPATANSGPIQGNRQIFLIQKNLSLLGYDPGPVDGQGGPRTTSAIQAYQRKAGLTVDGRPSAKLLEHITHAAE
jgi:Putative peptidoglycan binding domain